MHEDKQTATILLAEDDQEDILLASEAFKQLGLPDIMRSVQDGEELMSYLNHQGLYDDPLRYPAPHLILLDLNMPRKNGFEVLTDIKSDPRHRTIPVVVFSTTRRTDDIKMSYQLGANSFISKPSDFKTLCRTLQMVTAYWLDIVTLQDGYSR